MLDIRKIPLLCGKIVRPLTRIKASCLVWRLAALPGCLASAALAGPPLVTDDPGVLEPGTWEIITALSGERLPSDERSRGVELDISYGLTSHSQLSFVLPHQQVDPPFGGTRTGFGAAAAAYKWQFHAGSRWQMAIAPAYSTPVSGEFNHPDGTEQPSALGIPFLISYEQDARVWNAQFGWSVDSNGDRSWDYGLAMIQSLGHSTHWMLEVFGTASSSFNERALNFQFGFDHEIDDRLHLLGAAGRGIRAWSRPAHELEFRFYLGLQWYRP